jgi:ubiquinol oxidase
VTGYKERKVPANTTMSLEELRKKGYVLTEAQWMYRILFLETIAAVPGMAAATIRHLQSLRLMRRDSGWIHTLLVRVLLALTADSAAHDLRRRRRRTSACTS